MLRMFWRLHVHGAERVPLSGPLIVACNHVSYFDPPALGVAMPRPIHYMAKQELFDIPVLGRVITWLNAFPVDRSRGDRAAIKRSLQVLQNGATPWGYSRRERAIRRGRSNHSWGSLSSPR